jgi:membrane associated rhomboid family serine protease
MNMTTSMNEDRCNTMPKEIITVSNISPAQEELDIIDLDAVDSCDYDELQNPHLQDTDEFSLRLVDLSDHDSYAWHTSGTESVSGLVERMHASTGDDLATSLDFDLKRRIKDFRFAQTQRRKRYSHRPYGIMGLFINLSDTRADLRWAEDAAWRRSKQMPYLGWKDYEKARQMGMKRCYFTFTVMFVSTVMMVIAFYWNQWKIEPLAVNPLAGPKPDILLLLGALQMREMVATGTWYRLLTAIFLHGGIIHLIVNMIAIGLLGRAVERNHGFAHAAVIFLISALGGNIISCIMQPGYILVGSSGGLFGLMGSCVADIVLNWKLLFLVYCNQDGSPASCSVKFCSMFWLLSDLSANAIIGFTPFVDNFAHMGGLSYGFLMSLTVLQQVPLSFFGRGNGVFFKMRISILRIAGGVLALSLLVTTTLLLRASEGVRSPCHRCRYISCLPFPFWTSDKWWYCDGCDAVDGEVFKYDAHDEYLYTDLDLYCPGREDTMRLDISGDGYRDVSDVQDSLSRYCRDYCF